MNDRRTLSSIEYRTQTAKVVDPRRVVSEQGFRYYHRTATPLSNGRTSQSALSWKAHDHTNIESPVRRLARFTFLCTFYFLYLEFYSFFTVLNVIILNKNLKIQQALTQLIDRYRLYVSVRYLCHQPPHLIIAHQRIELTSETRFFCLFIMT